VGGAIISANISASLFRIQAPREMSIKAAFSQPARGGVDLSQGLVARFSQTLQPLNITTIFKSRFEKATVCNNGNFQNQKYLSSRQVCKFAVKISQQANKYHVSNMPFSTTSSRCFTFVLSSKVTSFRDIRHFDFFNEHSSLKE
jgi:hypothetical protein